MSASAAGQRAVSRMESLLPNSRTLYQAMFGYPEDYDSPHMRDSVLNYSAVKSKLYFINNFKKREPQTPLALDWPSTVCVG